MLVNWPQTCLTQLACFLSFASLFSFQKSREDRTYSRNASVDKLNGVAMQVCRINQINIKGISGCSARFPNYLNLIAKVQKCPFSLQFFSLRSRFCQIPMTRIKRKRRLIKSKLVNPINVRRWRSSKFLCIRARSLVWPSLKGHRGRIAGILSNKGSLLYILRSFITWQSHWRSNQCSCILCHDLGWPSKVIDKALERPRKQEFKICRGSITYMFERSGR